MKLTCPICMKGNLTDKEWDEHIQRHAVEVKKEKCVQYDEEPSGQIKVVFDN